MSRPTLGIVLLTYNSANVIGKTVAAARRLSPHVVAVDSCSTDDTPTLLTQLGCEVLTRPFTNYAEQRNWAIDTIGDRFDWQLHLDADEVLDQSAIDALNAALEADQRGIVYILHRRTHFMGRLLRHGGAANWHLRLFAHGAARCENRLYDQHFISKLPSRRLAGWIDDLNVGNLTEWINRHNRWSSMEAAELLRGSDKSIQQIPGRISNDPRERRRYFKGIYYRLPRAGRGFVLFVFRYLFQLGFLDGRAGFYYAALQTLWFRILVDAKMAELESTRQATRDAMAKI
jgi:glycosyltransferase involved in cell wall biosynthesis